MSAGDTTSTWTVAGKSGRKENVVSNKQMANGGDEGRRWPGPKSGPGGGRRIPRTEPAAPRGGGGGGAADVNSLRDAVAHARSGTGEVKQAIVSATFAPRAPCYTALIQQCARTKSWQKALEVFTTMRETPGVKANTITYSALIGACSTSGRWQEAETVFTEMLEAAQHDPECRPNTITYSSLISACERGGRLDRALEWFDRMKDAGVAADGITYSALLSACERAGDLDAALRLLEGMHAAGLQATQDAYVRLIERLGKRRDWGGALEVFLAMQMAGCEATRAPCLALLGAAEASGRAAPAVQLLEAYDAAGAAPDDDVLEAAVRVASTAAAEARAVWARLRAAPARPDPAAARLLHDACAGGSDAAGAEEIAADCKRLGVALPPAPPAPAPPAPRGA